MDNNVNEWLDKPMAEDKTVEKELSPKKKALKINWEVTGAELSAFVGFLNLSMNMGVREKFRALGDKYKVVDDDYKSFGSLIEKLSDVVHANGLCLDVDCAYVKPVKALPKPKMA